MRGRKVSLIETAEVKCRDCYKCVRECPVKAIRIESNRLSKDHHAKVVEENCIACGRCVQICPQNAKKVYSDIQYAKTLLDSEDTVIASLAPSFVAAFDRVLPAQIVTALKMLGFTQVSETAIGAEILSKQYARLFASEGTPMLSTACPVVVNLVEKYYPTASQFLAPLVSPMVAHGRYLKKRFPEAKVVFIGPCIAKIDEARRADARDFIDAVITFKDLESWFDEAGIDLCSLGESDFDGIKARTARLFPIAGGMLRAAELSTDILDPDVACIEGLEECQDMIVRFMNGEVAELPRIVELLACTGGCVGGPMNVDSSNMDVHSRKREVLEFFKGTSEQSTALDMVAQLSFADLQREPRTLPCSQQQPSEEEIRDILSHMGKESPADELNCGMCGYGSCREKAVAVYNGMASPEMCLSYMRRRAESKANLFLGAIPDGVVVVDPNGVIVETNGAAKRMFANSTTNMIGKPVAEFLEPSVFRKVIQEKGLLMATLSHKDGELITKATLFYEPKENLAMGIFQDVTEVIKQKEHLRRMREETLQKTQGVIHKQMEVAQKIAGLLGETTAQTKVLLTKLIKTLEEEDEQDGTSSRRC